MKDHEAVPVHFNIELTEDRLRVLSDVLLEAHRADRKFGEQDHGDLVWSVVLTEECGEAAQAVLQARAITASLKETATTVTDGTYRLEAIAVEVRQCAAVAIRWLEARERAMRKKRGEG